MVSLAGLPPPDASWQLPGADLTPGMQTGASVKDAAFGQITRCLNCTQSYAQSAHVSQCSWDSRADSGYSVPCCFTPRNEFDYMGMSIRTGEWRYTL